jgi:hypothetical protein
MSALSTPADARRWLLLATLVITGAVLVFFLVAPSVGYPLEFSQSLRLLEIVLPVFLGYLGASALFLFKAGDSQDSPFGARAATLVGPLVKGPVVVFALAMVALIGAFGFANTVGGASGMSVDNLAAALSLLLGLLTVTTNVVVSYLF